MFLPEQADTGVTVVQNMVRKQYNEWKADDSAQVDGRPSELKGKITVEDQFGKTNITVKINEEITWWEAFKSFKKNLKEKVSSIMKCDGIDDADDETNWTVQAYIGKGEPDGIQVGGGGQAAKGTSAASKDRGIEIKPLDMDSSIRDTSSLEYTMSAVSGSV